MIKTTQPLPGHAAPSTSAQGPSGITLVGLTWMALGGAALATPLMPVSWLELVVGGGLVLGGLGQTFGAGRTRRRAEAAPLFLAGLSALVAGLVLVAHHLGGILPLVLMIFLAIQGLASGWTAIALRDGSSGGGFLVSGLLSILLALSISAGWFCGAFAWLGFAVGLERLASGAALRRLG